MQYNNHVNVSPFFTMRYMRLGVIFFGEMVIWLEKLLEVEKRLEFLFFVAILWDSLPNVALGMCPGCWQDKLRIS